MDLLVVYLTPTPPITIGKSRINQTLRYKGWTWSFWAEENFVYRDCLKGLVDLHCLVHTSSMLMGISSGLIQISMRYKLFILFLVIRYHWRRKWQPTPVFLPWESHGQRSLVGCRLWDCTVSDTTEAMQQQQQQQQVSSLLCLLDDYYAVFFLV